MGAYHPSCTKVSITYKKHIEEIQVFEFLARLNLEYEHIRVHILNMHLLHSLVEVYAYVHREERRRGVMSLAPSIEKSTFVSSSSIGGRGGSAR